METETETETKINEMEREIINRKNIKILVSEQLNKPKDLLFLFTKGWSKRAGVIPYVIKDRKYFLLLGEKIKNNKLTDFGGGCKMTESPFTCALREFNEETRKTIYFDYRNITHIIITGKKGPHQTILMVHFPEMENEEENFKNSLDKNMSKGMNELKFIHWYIKDDILFHYNRNRIEESLINILLYLDF